MNTTRISDMCYFMTLYEEAKDPLMRAYYADMIRRYREATSQWRIDWWRRNRFFGL